MNRRTHRLRALGVAVVTCAALAGAVACGNVTVGGFGEATVLVSGDAQASAPAPAMALVPAGTSPAAAGPALSSSGDEPEGEVQVQFLLFLVPELGSPMPLGEELEAQVDLKGQAEADVLSELVPSARYTELQIVFQKIEAQVDSGLVIGGIPFSGEVEVELEQPTLAVTRPIDLDVTDGSSVELVVDLNAPAWLQALVPVPGDTALVDQTVFGSLVDVVVR